MAVPTKLAKATFLIDVLSRSRFSLAALSIAPSSVACASNRVASAVRAVMSSPRPQAGRVGEGYYEAPIVSFIAVCSEIQPHVLRAHQRLRSFSERGSCIGDSNLPTLADP